MSSETCAVKGDGGLSRLIHPFVFAKVGLGRRREACRLADEALATATRHGYQQLVPRIRRLRDSIPAGAE
jgi:hypothetical protein